MNKILVTGGAGYIGSHTCLVLLQNGFEVIVIDSFLNSKKESLKRVSDIIKQNHPNYAKNLSINEGDIRNENLLKEIFLEENKTSPISAVIHFAGLKSVEDVNIDYLPFTSWDGNHDPENGDYSFTGIVKMLQSQEFKEAGYKWIAIDSLTELSERLIEHLEKQHENLLLAADGNSTASAEKSNQQMYVINLLNEQSIGIWDMLFHWA